MANEKIMLMAEANRLGIDGYRRMDEDELRAAIARATKADSPVKGKSTASNGSKGKTAATEVVKGKSPAQKGKAAAPAKGKGKPPAKKNSQTTAKRAPAKSKARQSSPAKGKAAQGTAKRPATGGAKKKATTTAKKPSTPARADIDNTKINWKAESTVGTTGKRKIVLDALRKYKGDKLKVWEAIGDQAKKFYPGRSKDEAERLTIWLIGRVAYDFVFKTGQHEPGKRAAYGTSTAAQDVRRREEREEARKEFEKAERAKKRAKAAGKPSGAQKGKTAAKRK